MSRIEKVIREISDLRDFYEKLKQDRNKPQNQPTANPEFVELFTKSNKHTSTQTK